MQATAPPKPRVVLAAYRSDLPPLPSRLSHLSIDERGFPVPWFVAWIDGKPDFRVIRPKGIAEAWNNKTCWLCGGKLGVYLACVVGPMCGINRVTSEPPSHLECAEYAVKACPFLTRPLAVRNERGLPEDRHVSGESIARNPGVTLLWVTREVKPFKVHNGVLFKLGDPTSYSFWREKRRATRAEVEESVRAGLPALEAAAKKDGPQGEATFRAYIKKFEDLLPPACFVPKPA